MGRPILLEPPPHLVDLPRDSRGYLVPAEAPWTDEGPRLAGLDPHRSVGLAIHRACCVCGFSLVEGQLVWRTLSQKDAAKTRVHDSYVSVDTGFGGHLSCMIYSAFACPYWASSAGKLGKSSAINPGAPRGTRPSILGHRDIWIMIHEDPRRPFLGPPSSNPAEPLFAYVDLMGDVPFRDPQDLLDRYEEALCEDSKAIDIAANRQYWKRSDEDQLNALISQGLRALEGRPFAREMVYNDELRTAYALPLIAPG